MSDILSFSRDRYQRHGTVSWADLFGTRMVLVLGPEAIGTVLMNKDRAFASEPGWGYFLGEFFGGGVMLKDSDEHLFHRRIMQQAFTRDRLVGYLAGINSGIDRDLDGWVARDHFPVYHRIKQLTLDIGTQVFMGAQIGSDADRVNRAFVDTVHAGLAVVRANVPGGAWSRGVKGRRVLEEFMRAELPAKRSRQTDDLFSVLCHAVTEEGERFGDDEVIDHMVFVLMAAHDTSTITASMAAYQLGAHPEWQDRAREESLALGKTAIEYHDLARLPMLDLVIKETLRMYSPVGALARKTVKDTELDGCFIPAGTLLSVGLHPTQRMEPWWTDPDRFDPERFAEHRREDKSHRFAFAPFGAGVHKCIGLYFGGMEVTALLHQMLLRYTWEAPAGYQPRLTYTTGPTPTDGLPLTLRSRS